MNRRHLLLAALLLLLAGNTWYSATRIMAFVHRHRGEKALAAAEVSDAYESLLAGVSWQPGDAPAYILIARTIQGAEANGLRIAALDGKTPLERLAAGVGALGRAVALNPADAWAWSNLADLYRGAQSGRLRLERITAIVEASKAGTPPPEPIAADAPLRTPQPEDRVMAAAALMAQSLEPEFFFYHDFLARLYWERGHAEEASREIEVSFESTPSPDAHSVLSTGALMKELSPAILAGIEKSEANPNVNPIARVRAQADILRYLSRNEEAIKAYERLAGMGGADLAANSFLIVGELLQSEGRYSESIGYLERVRRVDPEGEAATAALFDLGESHARLGNHVEALELLRSYLTKRPGTLNVLLDLAGELAAAGRNDEAERIYLSALRGFPEEVEVYIHLIEHLLKQRRLDEAVRYADRLAALAPEDERVVALIHQVREARSQGKR